MDGAGVVDACHRRIMFLGNNGGKQEKCGVLTNCKLNHRERGLTNNCFLKKIISVFVAFSFSGQEKEK